MNTKHTPGPWYVTGKGLSRYVEGCVSPGVLQEVAWCGATEVAEQMEANARLIAAAPDLLEACATFAEWMRREKEGFVNAGNERDTPEGEARWRAWYSENLRLCDLAQEQALAAVAKATGASHVSQQ